MDALYSHHLHDVLHSSLRQFLRESLHGKGTEDLEPQHQQLLYHNFQGNQVFFGMDAMGCGQGISYMNHNGISKKEN